MPQSPEPQRNPEDVATTGPQSSASSAPAAPPARQRARWKRRLAISLLIVLVLLAVLVGFAPTIASTSAVYNGILGAVNSNLQGKLQVDELHLSWGGPIAIHGLRVTDPQQQQVLHIPRVVAEAGVWRLLTSTMAFGEITLDSPALVIEQNSDGQLTLAQAFESRRPTPSTPKPAGELPAPEGRLIVKNGAVKVVRPGATPYDMTELDGQVDLKTLNEVGARFALTLADGTKLAGEAAVRRLLTQGKLDPRNASGDLRLSSDRNVQIGPLAALAGQPGLQGGLNVDVDAKLDSGTLDGRFTIAVAGLQSEQRAAANATPINAELKGQVRWADNQLAANLNLAGEAGQAQAELAYRGSDQPSNFTVDELVTAALSGKPVAVPDFTMRAQAEIDLAKLGRAVPELLNVKEGVELTAGRLELADLTIQGGATPIASAKLSLKDVAARGSDKAIRLEPVQFSLDSALESGRGLQVRGVELTASSMQLKASGPANDLHAAFKADLGRLQQELGQVFDLGALELAGNTSGTVDFKRVNDEQIDVGIRATVEGLRYASVGRRLDGAVQAQTSIRPAAEARPLTLGGEWLVQNARLDGKALADGDVKLTYDVKLDQDKQSITIDKCSLASKALTAEVAGTIAQYTGDCQLNLQGRYSASWEAVTALLHKLTPATADTVIIAGNSASEFKITGPACAKTQPGFRDMSTGAGVTWTSAELYGVRMGAAQLAPALKDGRLTLPKATIPAGDGKVNLGAVIDFQPADPTLQMPGKTKLLENVPVTKELGAQLLSRINPIFLHVANIEGRVNLGLQDVSVPLGDSIKQDGTAQGRLDLGKMKMQPGGLAAELLALGGMDGSRAYPVEVGALDFVMKDGRIRYDDFMLVFPGDFDLKFRGSVGLDDTLELVVSIPLRAPLLDRLGAKGPTEEYAERLRGTRVELPILGTREKPRLDFSKVDVQALLKDVLLKEPAKQLEGFLKGLGGQDKKP